MASFKLIIHNFWNAIYGVSGNYTAIHYQVKNNITKVLEI